jgi:hypothetical protein
MTVSDGTTVTARTVRHIVIDTRRSYEDMRSEFELAVPVFDRLEAIGVVVSGGNWEAITRLSNATAIHRFVRFFTFDPSPVMKINGNEGHAVTYLVGNIIMAERGFSLEPASFLYVPLRVVIREGSKGNALLALDLPTDLFAVFGSSALDEVGLEFGAAFAELLEYLRVPVPPELASSGK